MQIFSYLAALLGTTRCASLDYVLLQRFSRNLKLQKINRVCQAETFFKCFDEGKVEQEMHNPLGWSAEIQCDQMARLFLNIGPFTLRKICPMSLPK